MEAGDSGYTVPLPYRPLIRSCPKGSRAGEEPEITPFITLPSHPERSKGWIKQEVVSSAVTLDLPDKIGLPHVCPHIAPFTFGTHQEVAAGLPQSLLAKSNRGGNSGIYDLASEVTLNHFHDLIHENQICYKALLNLGEKYIEM